jgi:hypothetical protein
VLTLHNDIYQKHTINNALIRVSKKKFQCQANSRDAREYFASGATTKIHRGLFCSGVLGCIRDNLTSRETLPPLTTASWKAVVLMGGTALFSS